MVQVQKTFDFYILLGVQPQAGEAEIGKAYDAFISSLEPDKKPPEERKEAAVAVIAADAAREVLLNAAQRRSFDAKLEEFKRAASEKEKIEARRAGKLQEQQSIEDDEKLKQVSLHLDAAGEALADFYYEQLFAAAKKRTFETIPLEKLLEWLSFERAELLRTAEQKGRRIAFRIDWHGFEDVRAMRKKRGEEISATIDILVKKLEKEQSS